MTPGLLVFPVHRIKSRIAQRIKVALPFRPVFTPVWNCFVNLVPRHDGDSEKRVNATSSRKIKSSLSSYKKLKQVRDNILSISPGGAGYSAAVIRHTVMQQ